MSDVYRCKNCGQLINPERNKICPACRIELAGNIVKETNKKWNVKNPFFVICGLIIGIIILFVVLPKTTKESSNESKEYVPSSYSTDALAAALKNNEKTEKNSSLKTQTSTTSSADVQTSTKLSWGIKQYFVKKEDVRFVESNANVLLLDNYGEQNYKESFIAFSFLKYSNGDYWICDKNNHVYFVPFEHVSISNSDYILLFPVDKLSKDFTISSGFALPNFIYTTEEASTGMVMIAAENYAPVQTTVLEIFKNKVLGGEEIDAVYVSERTEKYIVLKNITVQYQFDNYKKFQTNDGIEYETNDGKRYSNYMDIPHTITVNNEKSFETTIFYSEMEIE